MRNKKMKLPSMPVVIMVTDSQMFVNEFKREILPHLPGLEIAQFSSRDGIRYLKELKVDKLRTEGIDWWIPKESAVQFNRSFRRQLSQYIR